MGNTQTHRGGRRSGGRQSRDTQAGPRGPGASSPPASRGPQGAWPRPANNPAVGPAATLGPRTPFEAGTQPVPPLPPVNPASNGRGKPAPDPLRKGNNGNGASRPADRRRTPRDPFASPPPGAAALPAWSENGGHHGGVPPTPPAPLVHLHGANGHLALDPPPADTETDAAAPTSAPDVESWTPRSERSSRAAHAEREHEPLRPGVRGEVGPLIEALHALFERDRAIASLGTSTRCGICYLHYARTDLVYREAEGFYACASCAQSLGSALLNMVRRQQK